MENKGAQAMTFTVINEIKKRYPDKDIVVNCPDEDKGYAFELLKIGKKLKVELLGGVYRMLSKGLGADEKVNTDKRQMLRLLSELELIVDISGFALSSQFSLRHSVNFIANIMLAQKYRIPMVLLSQSFGPFDYQGLAGMIMPPLLKKYMTYPTYIYARELEGMEFLKPYTRRNVKKSVDIVLQGGDHYDPRYLFRSGAYAPKPPVEIKPGSVAIIPNVKTMKYGSRQTLLSMYGNIVDRLLSHGIDVCLIRHSTEDLAICQQIKANYAQDERVRLLEDEFDCIEIHGLLQQFRFVVASRYHSIIHSYKNGIPAIAIGWATKYRELLDRFGQSEYIFDVRQSEHLDRHIADKLDRMVERREVEAKTIAQAMNEIRRATIFDEAFEALGRRAPDEARAALQPSEPQGAAPAESMAAGAIRE